MPFDCNLAILKPVKAIIDFFTDKIWNADFNALKTLKRGGYSFCRLLVVATRGFFEDRCTLQSCALTYVTMVSLVPILAVALSFCKGIGLQKQLLEHMGIATIVQRDSGGNETFEYKVIHDGGETGGADESESLAEELARPGFVAELPEPMQEGLIKLITYVDKTNFTALGIIVVVTLLATVVMSIQKLESNFNGIWCVKQGRGFLRQISEYLVLLLLLPILLFCILSLNAYINSGRLSELLITNSSLVKVLGHVVARALLYFCLVAAFALLYLYMPNTHVRVGPAFLAGAVAAVMWSAVLIAYVKWQIGLARYNAIYGAFAALPFFLAWLYANWLVILLGAEICFAAQNQRILRQTKQMLPVEAGANRMLGIAIVEAISKCYDEGHGCWNAADFAMEHNVSIREIEFTLESLRKAGLVIQRKPEADPPDSYDYILGRPSSQITLADVSDAFTGIDTATARRIAKCLPAKFADYLREWHDDDEARLSKITFEHVVEREAPASTNPFN